MITMQADRKQFTIAFSLACLLHIGALLALSQYASLPKPPKTVPPILTIVQLTEPPIPSSNELDQSTQASAMPAPSNSPRPSASPQHPQTANRKARKTTASRPVPAPNTVQPTPEPAQLINAHPQGDIAIKPSPASTEAAEANHPTAGSATNQGNRSEKGSSAANNNQPGNDNGGNGNGKGTSRGAKHTFISKRYPQSLQDRQIQGPVRVRVRVSAEGKALAVTIISSPAPELVPIAEQAARNGRYRPALKNGEAVEETIEFAIRYEITR